MINLLKIKSIKTIEIFPCFSGIWSIIKCISEAIIVMLHISVILDHFEFLIFTYILLSHLCHALLIGFRGYWSIVNKSKQKTLIVTSNIQFDKSQALIVYFVNFPKL